MSIMWFSFALATTVIYRMGMRDVVLHSMQIQATGRQSNDISMVETKKKKENNLIRRKRNEYVW